MKPVLRLDTAAGRRDVPSSELPVALGLSASGEALFGAQAEADPLAWLGTADGALFLQRTASDTDVRVNGEPLEGSVWLAAGDEISLAAVIIDADAHNGGLRLKPRPPRPRPVLVPPPSVPPDAAVTTAGEELPAPATQPPAGSDALAASDTSDARPPAPLSSPSGVSEASAPPSPALEALLPISHPAGPRRRPWAAWGLLTLLVAGVLMTLVAAPLTVIVTPAPDRLSVIGLLPPLKFADRYLALPGEYRLEAEKEGYHRLESTFSFGFNDQPQFEFELVKLPGRLRVDTASAARAQVFIDGIASGETPLVDVEVSAGPHTLMLVAERFLPAEVTVDVLGMGRDQRVDVELVPDWGHARIETEPAGAMVVVDDEPAGPTPLRLERKAGTYTLQLHKQGWQSVSQSLQFQANSETVLPVFVLDKAPATVALTSTPSAATVLVDGSPRGSTPLELALSADAEHEIVVYKQGYERVSRTVRLDAGEAHEMTLALARQYGIVFFASKPADAMLTIDGEARGTASQRMRLSAAPHQVEISKPGYDTYTTTVTPDPTLSKNVEVTLQRAGQSAAATSRPAAAPAGVDVGHAMLEFRLDKPVRFSMGASRREQGRRSNEVLHTVELTRSFMLGEKEVTNAQFRRFDPAHDSGSAFGHGLDDDAQPVVNVTWDAAARYTNWLSDAAGLPHAYEEKNGRMTAVKPMTEGYRLPLESEWAYVARYAGEPLASGKGRKYAWPGDWPPSRAVGNFADSSAAARLRVTVPGYNDGQIVTAKPGNYAPNKGNAYDMEGNVSEWCHDFYDVYTGAEESITIDPSGPDSGRNHVIRGGSWRHGSVVELRLSYRDYGHEGRNDLGFRVARHVRN